MNPLELFEDEFNQNYQSLADLLRVVSQPAPPRVDDILSLSVADYLASIDVSEQALRDIPIPSLVSSFSFIAQRADAASVAIVQGLIDQDDEAAFGTLNAGRAFVAGIAPNVSMQNFIIAMNPNFDFGDVGSGSADVIEQTFISYQLGLKALLWSEQNGDFVSPRFAVDESTGDWIATGIAGGTLNGTADTLFAQLGKGAALALMSDIGARTGLLETLIGQGAGAADFDAAFAASEVTIRTLFESLQSEASSLSQQDGAGVQSQIAAQMQSVIDTLENALPGLSGELDALTFGARNLGEHYLVSPQGTAVGSTDADWFVLSRNADAFDGGLGDDILFGLDGKDSLSGGDGSDHLFGGLGDDLIDGGAGDGDVAGFDAALGNYTLRFSDDGSITAQDRALDGLGTDTLSNVETLTFSAGASIFTDGFIELAKFQGISGLNETEIATFVELYIAYFNRAPDALGLYFWGSAFANGTSLEETATLFLDQDETRATYPAGESNLDFATQVYSNVLGRVADQGGLDFWEGQLNSGGVSRGAFILEVLRGAKADPAEGATQEFIDLQTQDRAYLSDKTDIGTYFAVIKGLSDVQDASATMQLYLRGDESSVQTAVAAIDAEFALAQTADSGELILQLVGVADEPFAFV